MMRLFACFAVWMFLACDRDTPARCTLPTGESTCRYDTQCDDRVFCNGREICEPGNPGASSCGCVRKADSLPCDEEGRTCHEQSGGYCGLAACEPPLGERDSDRDGADSLACGGTDCDDSNPNRTPGRPEICDLDNVDEDCDFSTFGKRDLDQDGFMDSSCCNVDPAGHSECGNDCHDTDAQVHPIAPEVCNGVDDNCDGGVDDLVATLAYYIDVDGDGFGTGDPITSCLLGAGYSVLATDCDDSEVGLYPGQIKCGSNPQLPADYLLCQDGAWIAGSCTATTTCKTQPGGMGICK